MYACVAVGMYTSIPLEMHRTTDVLQITFYRRNEC